MEIVKLKINDLIVKENYRGKVGDVSELMESIKENGLLQPIGVSKTKKGYEVVFGNRRFSATKKLGLPEIECILLSNEQNKTILNIVENMQRKDVALYEVGRAINTLITKDKLSIPEIVVRLGSNQNYIRTAINAFNVTPVQYRSKVVSMDTTYKAKGKGLISSSVSNTINSTKGRFNLTKAQVHKFYEYAQHNGLSHSQVRTISKLMQAGQTFETALVNYEKIKVFRPEVCMPKAEFDRLTQAYGPDFINHILHHQTFDKIKPIKKVISNGKKKK